jgi:hypothetical protein
MNNFRCCRSGLSSRSSVHRPSHVETPWIHGYIRMPPVFKTIGQRPIRVSSKYLIVYPARDRKVTFHNSCLQLDMMLKSASNCCMSSGCLSGQSIFGKKAGKQFPYPGGPIPSRVWSWEKWFSTKSEKRLRLFHTLILDGAQILLPTHKSPLPETSTDWESKFWR